MSPQIATRAKLLSRLHRLRERLAADIFEEPVDAVWQRRLHLFREIRRLVIDADCVAQLLNGVGALLRAAGDPDSPGARMFRELPHD